MLAGSVLLNLESFLSNDDTVTGYHIHKWQDCSSENLSNLCKRFIHRNLLKAFNISSDLKPVNFPIFNFKTSLRINDNPFKIDFLNLKRTFYGYPASFH